MKPNQNCKYFITDRPCELHKKTGVVCETCSQYIPIKTKILIIKLDAIGDVLRTTFLLPILTSKYENSEITWLVSKKSKPVLENNEYIDKIWTTSDPLIAINLQMEKFDIVINVDLAIESLCLSGFAKASKKFGFVYENGQVKSLNKAAEKLLNMSMSDVLKKENRKTYQELIADICELEYHQERIIVPITENAKKFANEKIKKDKIIVGLNIGSGVRWKTKRWARSCWEKLADILIKNSFQIISFAGPEEEELIGKGIINTGNNNSVENFFGLLNMVDILVTGDTMAMHAALGLGKKVVALFGPTSQKEIEMYGNGIKLAPDIDCLCCYKIDCNEKCISNLKPEEVYDAISKICVAEEVYT